jgi:hypothetical protein
MTTRREESLINDLKENFNNLNRYKLKINPTKCSFVVSAGQLLGFLASARGIEANPEKIQEILKTSKTTRGAATRGTRSSTKSIHRTTRRKGSPIPCTHEKFR